jgi:hypothetical protein
MRNSYCLASRTCTSTERQTALAPARMLALQVGKPAPRSARYNREVRFASVLLLILCLAACQHGIQTNEAVRQGVIDHLKKAGLNVDKMDITVSAVEFKGNKATAVVSMTAKGVQGGMPMAFKYQLEQQDKKWVVTGRDTSGAAHGNEAAPAANPHGGGAMPDAMPGAANPHGGGAAMPSPNDLPPAKKK